ncbi:cellulose synthase operon protein YhjU [Cupriavidus sp. YR651]|uniref:cellulose biosynthesis protein BcsG n=1 Tax=Cupriavidus sp. YR651 TaxID=1855315 RepID=UPI0008910AD2|nr:cellulose biosynthesis protein BcsG [Cupriavidus sp. YR651]SDC84866.1 cellulose synthase operon protein YhjU [Cupriavidus sp. YR651]
MGLWNLYFLAKLYLFHTGQLHPQWLFNIALALLLVVPMETRYLRVLRQVLAIIVGAALAWRESTLPPFARVVSQFSNIQAFTPAYLLELAQRLISLQMVVAIIVVLIAYWLVNRWLRVTTLVLIALVAMPFWYGVGVGNPATRLNQMTARAADTPRANIEATNSYDAILAAFREQEAQRTATVAPLTASPDAQFDIIVLHICSLSWDDLDAAKALNHPLLSRFDYLFKNFSSAASYSGPAAIRLLRASCGQQAHQDLYSPAPDECHLFQALAQAGFGPHILMNHDGRFDNFHTVVETEIGAPGLKPEPTDGVPVAMRAFDDSPVLSDFATFDHWYRQRLTQNKGPVALYYNTVTLHDGNRLPGKRLTSLESYPLRLGMLLGDVDKIIETISKSGRKAVVVFVPEHGAALRGDQNQISGLREIPTPHIIHVPVGVKLIGLPTTATTDPVSIEAPSSFLALSQLVFNLVADSPFRQGAPALAHYAEDLPQTQMVGENEGTVTMKRTNGYVIHTPDGVWVEQK